MNQAVHKMIKISSKDELGIPHEILAKFDNYLASNWDIRFRKSDFPIEAVVSSDPTLAKFATIFEREQQHLQRKGSISKDFYNQLCKPPILGVMTSQRRHFLLDSLAITYALIKRYELSGPVLDFGCNSGFFVDTLSTAICNKMHGIDTAGSAIRYAKSKINKSGVTFSEHFDRSKHKEKFSVTTAVSVLPSKFKDAKEIFKMIGESLNENGIAIIVDSHLLEYDLNLLRKTIKKNNLGFAFADVVGGYGGYPTQFEVESALILVKGLEVDIPDNFRELSENEWHKFQNYANAPSTPDEKKIQSYSRAIN